MNDSMLRLISALIVSSVVMLLAGCGGSSEDGSPDADTADAAEAPETPSAADVPGPPADFVPYRCSTCSCRVFTGDGAYCNRPACKHLWSDHQRPPA